MATIIPKEGEEVLMHLHKSLFVMWKQMLAFKAALIISTLLFTFLYAYPEASVFAAVLLVTALIYAFYYFLIWYYDVNIITNRRVITHAKNRLFGHEFAEFGYDEVVDISYAVKGFLASVFQFGTVNVALANGQIRALNNLGSPAVVQETLKNLVDVTKRKK